MNKLFKAIVIAFWMLTLFIFFKYRLYIDGSGKIINFLNSYPNYSSVLFVLIASLRIFTLIPCTVFIIIAGIMFSPLKAFTLIAAANLLSEALLFIFVKITVGMNYQDSIMKKYPKVYNMIKRNNIKILALGVSSPVIPSDIVCFFSAISGISFSKYILTIFLSDTPLILLYTFLGVSIKYSMIVFAITLMVIITVSCYNLKKWNKQVSLEN